MRGYHADCRALYMITLGLLLSLSYTVCGQLQEDGTLRCKVDHAGPRVFNAESEGFHAKGDRGGHAPEGASARMHVRMGSSCANAPERKICVQLITGRRFG